MADEVKPEGTFQNQVVTAFGTAANDALAKHPELRSVIVVFDWEEGLNDGAISGISRDRNGPIAPGNADAILGSMEQMCKIMKVQTGMGLQVVDALRRAASGEANKLGQVQEQLRATSTELEETKGDEPREPGSNEAEKAEEESTEK